VKEGEGEVVSKRR